MQDFLLIFPPLVPSSGLAGTLLGDAVFGPSGTHVVLAKVASCSCLGVCWYYVETFNGYRCALSTAATLKRLSFGGKESDGPKPSIGGTKSSAVDDSSSASASTSTAASVMPGFLALLYCAGLFSNSFIEVGESTGIDEHVNFVEKPRKQSPQRFSLLSPSRPRI